MVYLMSPFVALLLTFAAAIAWLRTLDFFAHKGWIESRLSRKIIHIGTGPIYVLCWLLFPGEWYDRWLAALVPGLITIQFVLVGLGLIKDEATVKSMARSGDRREILRGPLFYGIVFVALTLIYWKTSPIGITALMLMCGGDGVADLVGRRLPKPKLPWSPRKSLIGSLSVFAGGWILSVVILSAYIAAGVLPGPLSGYLFPVTLIALGGMLVESLPYPDVDNITVTVAAMLIGHLAIWP
jgi:phytol kinase